MTDTNDIEFPDYSEERELREMLRMLQLQYQRAAKPYIDRLVQLEMRKPLPPTIVTLEQALKMGLIK